MRRLLAIFTRRLLHFAVAITPPEQREWISAVLTEAELIRNETEAFRWAVGALSLACRCRLLATPAIMRENLLMDRTSSLSVLALAVVIAVLSATPTFRDAATILPASIRLASGHSVLSTTELRLLAAGAEERRDASTLAFAAIHFKNPADSLEAINLANKAIALDPSLAWIRYFVIRNDWRFNTRRTTFAADVPQLIAADPDNAAGYLLLAESIHRSDPSLTTRRAEWQSAMDHAFSAPRYDNYLNRRLQLDHSVLRTHRLSPFVAASSAFWAAVPDATGILLYCKQMLASNEPQASKRVVRFARMFEDGQTGIEQAVAENLKTRAAATLNGPQGLISAPRRTLLESSITHQWRFKANLVQGSLLTAFVFTIATALLAAAVLLFRKQSKSMQRLLRGCVTAAILALLCAFLSYLPFASAYHRYQLATTAREAAHAAMPFAAFDVLPSRLHLFFISGEAQFYAWQLLIFAVSLALVFRLAFHFIRARRSAHNLHTA